MTLPGNAIRKCAVCGAKTIQGFLVSTNQFGSPDLDLRPPEMMRSTMGLWVQECPHCGYVSGCIEDATSVDIQWLRSEKFQAAVQAMHFLSDLSVRFYKHALISTEDGNAEKAFSAMLHAAWSCDDSGDKENAQKCREFAITLLDELICRENNENHRVMRMDIIRRAGQFEQLVSEYRNVEFSSEILEQVRRFQIARAEARDASCYTVDDALMKRE